MNRDPDISIVVLNWNTSDLLSGALKSIVSTTHDLTYEVVVIDNASTDGGFDRIDQKFKNDSRFSFIQNEKNIGWAAINIMLKRSHAKYIATVDPDALLHPGALQTLYSFMEAHPNAGAATASLFNPDGSPQRYYRRIMTPASYFFTTIPGRLIDKYFLGLRHWKSNRYDDLDITRISELEQPPWPCLIWRREALGPYIVNERVPFYFPDIEMSRRLYNGGYKIYLVPQATITHLKSTSYNKKESSWRRREYNRSLIIYFKTHYPFIAPLVWVAAWIDRGLRFLSRSMLGREPLR
jgi:GT2 family glycosyltransferase